MAADWIELTSGELSAAIDPHGAELSSLTDAAGRELLTDADPRWWTGRAPLLFPIVGRLAGDSYRLGDRNYQLPQHGFARRKTFTLIEQAPGALTLRLAADKETRAAYPFDFQLDVSFQIRGPRLEVAVTVANLGERDMPFSFGFHPAFAWPLPFGAAADGHRILFDQGESADIRRVDAETGLIAAAAEPSPVAGRELLPDAAMFERDALIWDRLNSRGLLWGVPGEANLRIEFPDTPWLGLWQKPARAIFASSLGQEWPTRSASRARFGTSLESCALLPPSGVSSALRSRSHGKPLLARAVHQRQPVPTDRMPYVRAERPLVLRWRVLHRLRCGSANIHLPASTRSCRGRGARPVFGGKRVAPLELRHRFEQDQAVGVAIDCRHRD
jgi:galactose mutarotase-like enzyme